VKHSSDYGIETGEVKADFQKIIERSRGIAGQMSKGVEYLFKKNNITLINGIGKIIEKGKVQVTDSENVATIYETKHIILATGSRSKELPFMKQDGKKIIGYRQALSLDKLPETMIVAGSGAIGTELAFFYNSMGTQVTIVEFLPNIVPTEDEEVSKTLARSLKKVKIKIMTESAVESVDTSGEKCKVTIKTKKGEEILEADIILSAIGIMPNIENLGIEENKIELEKGKIKVDDYYKTNIDGIYAIGDIVRGPALAHVASAEGIICIENIAGLNPKPLDYENIPGAIYTTPEVASVGFSEAKAIEAGYKIKIGKFPFTASGKATAAGNRDGFIKLVFDEETDKILGAHMIGMNVTEMISEIVVARNLGAKGHQIIKSVHPHPTMSEAIMEAAANAHNEAIHI
jgi:dihydrolipoamide dehydrogenase